MCGIVGVLNYSPAVETDRGLLKRMADKLTHRGPDEEGYYIDASIAFGFKRLSIIDLSGGQQPMFNEDKSLVSICNGEIYNYKELRSDLIEKGHHLTTNCDVEVLVHLYEEYGPSFIEQLNGQFAFAIFDKQNNQLMIARDHFGIAPIFYTQLEDKLVFGSEIKAILEYPEVKHSVNLQALDQVLSFPGLVSPNTMFEGIYALKPGHYALIKDGKITHTEYWDLDYPKMGELEEQPEEYYLENLDRLLRKSVEYRLNADVPVGFYLSGGLDSSLIGGLVKHCAPDKERISFSIGFNQGEIDERTHQQLMVQHLNSDHHEIVFDWEDIESRFQDMVYYAESPVKESYNTCSMALSESVRNNDIKVILTGEGADELFAGYVGYRFDEQRAQMEEDMSMEKMLEDNEREILWGNPDFFYEKNQYEYRDTKLALYSDSVNEQFDHFNSVRDTLVDKSKLEGRHHLHIRSYLDFKLRMSDHLISDHGDRMAYANSIEARYPFLDVNLVNFVKTIPPRLKLNGLIEKYILKQVARSYIPKEIFEREKFGFVAPGSSALLKKNIPWVNRILSYETISRQGYFNPDTIERLKELYSKDDFKLNLPFESDLLMIVLTFGVFLERFDMPDYQDAPIRKEVIELQ